MSNSIVLRKTRKGEEEIQTRTHHLERALRNVLIVVDGSSSIAQIREKAAGLEGLGAGLQYLLDNGFVEVVGRPVESASGPGFGPLQAREEMIILAKALLREDAAKVVAKLQAAPASREGLQEAAGQCRKLVRLTIDEKKAEELTARWQSVLAKL